MKVQQIPVEAIEVVQGHNFREDFDISDLEESMASIGLLHPIRVVEGEDGSFKLNSGERRLRTAQKLGWEMIHAVLLQEVSQVDLELTAIDENIIRRDLQGAALDKALARRKELYLAKHPETAQRMGPRPEDAVKSFAEDTADKTGKSSRTIERSVRRAEQLSPLTMEAYESGQLSQTQADIMSSLPHEDQDRVLEDIIGKSVGETRRIVSGDLEPETEEIDPGPMKLLQELYARAQSVVDMLDTLGKREDLDDDVFESVANLQTSLNNEFDRLLGDTLLEEDEDEDEDAFPTEAPF